MRLLWLADDCRAAGLEVVEVDGWRTRGAELGKVGAVLAHHTASARTAADTAVDRLLRDGRPGIPGPLAQVGLDRKGRVRLIAAGLANHAGAGSWRGVSGNSRAVGVEAFNDGVGEPWPLVQLAAWDRLNAVLLHGLNLGPESLCAHREWAPTRKTDPQGLDMGQMRARAAAALNRPTGGFLMALTDQQQTELFDAVARLDRRTENIEGAVARFDAALPDLLEEASAEEIAAAIPDSIAEDVVKALGNRLNGGAA